MSSTIEECFMKVSYNDYYSASGRPSEPTKVDQEQAVYNPYSIGNITTVLICVARLFYAILFPYAVSMILCMLLLMVWEIHPFTMLLLCMSTYPVLRHFYGVVLKSPFGRFARPFQARYAPGLYSSPDTQTRRIVQMCPSLSHESVTFGDVYDAKANKVIRATPWLLSGDFRTLLPFLSVHPPAVNYQRRWIRVPLSDHNGVCSEESANACEAVALDWMPPLDANSDDNTASLQTQPTKVIFLLAGLTGGSQEGYVKDVVYHARSQGIHVFVMVGRGLHNSPLGSDAMFHGARVSDAVTCAKAIRSCVGIDATIITVGISMGGFIVTNALVKTALSEYVDGVVNVAGCFDIIKNLNFERSRQLWHPLLAFGLKEAFVGTLKGWEVVKRRFRSQFLESSDAIHGNNYQNKHNISAVEEAHIHAKCSSMIDRLVDMYDFDAVMVTGIHGYDSVSDYYADMSAAPAMRRQYSQQQQTQSKEPVQPRFAVPLLVIHAMDDPVIHADTIPADPSHPDRPWIWENEIVLLTAMGGHMGWPVGLFPWQHGFRFTNTIITDFLESIHQIKLSPNVVDEPIIAATAVSSVSDATME